MSTIFVVFFAYLPSNYQPHSQRSHPIIKAILRPFPIGLRRFPLKQNDTYCTGATPLVLAADP